MPFGDVHSCDSSATAYCAYPPSSLVLPSASLMFAPAAPCTNVVVLAMWSQCSGLAMWSQAASSQSVGRDGVPFHSITWKTKTTLMVQGHAHCCRSRWCNHQGNTTGVERPRLPVCIGIINLHAAGTLRILKRRQAKRRRRVAVPEVRVRCTMQNTSQITIFSAGLTDITPDRVANLGR